MAKTAIIVLGMHRSGTSALTRVLNFGGATLPDDLVPGVAGNNEKGFFEPQELLLIDIRLLNALGMEWWSTGPFELQRLHGEALDAQRRQVRQFLTREFSGRSTLLLKDPRLCRLFPLWQEELERADAEIAVVMALRDPRAVAASLYERDGIPQDHACLMWLRHMLEAERNSRGLPRAVVEYERLLAGWQAETAAIADALAPVWTPDWSGAADAVNEFLEARLNHFDVRDGDEVLPELVAEAYSVFTALARGDTGEATARDRLDEIAEALGEMDELMGESLSWTTSQHVQLRLERDARRREMELIDSIKKDLTDRLEREARRTGELDAELGHMRRYAEGLQSERDQLEERVGWLAAEGERLRGQVADIERRLGKTRGSYERTLGDLESARMAESRLKNELLARNQAAEQALRQSLFDFRHFPRKPFNGWIHPPEAIIAAFNDARDDVGLEITRGTTIIDNEDSTDPANRDACQPLSAAWDKLSPDEQEACVDALLTRSLFDCHHVARQTGEPLDEPRLMARRYLSGGWQSGAAPIALFDNDHYCRQAFDCRVEQAPACPLLHYLLIGAAKGHSPHPLIDPEHYRRQLPAAIASLVEPLSHYLLVGWRQRIDPHWAFSVQWYLEKSPDVAAIDREPLGHYVLHGDAEGRTPHPFIDIAWYRDQHQVDSDIALRHFVEKGIDGHLSPHRLIDPDHLLESPGARHSDRPNWFQWLLDGTGDCRPNHLFSFDHYRLHNPDVAVIGLNPLLHYLTFGWRERRRPHVLFDAAWYATEQRLAEDVDPLAHYLSCKPADRRSGNPLFDVNFYRAIAPDLSTTRRGLFDHYVRHGGYERRKPGPDFDPVFYASQFKLPDTVHVLEHYLLIGKKLGVPCVEPEDTSTVAAGWVKVHDRPRPEGRPAVLLVAHVVTGQFMGGERSFIDMAKGLRETGLVDVIIALPHLEELYVAQLAPWASAIYVRPYLRWDHGKPLDERTVAAFKRLMANESGIRAVYANTITLREPLLAGQECGLPTIVHVRELIDQDPWLAARIGADSESIMRQVRELTSWFICNSATTRRLCDDDHSFVVPNTLDVRAFTRAVEAAEAGNPRADDIVRVGMIGSNIEKKGIGDFLRLARSCEQDVSMRFVMIGPWTDDLRHAIQADGKPSNLDIAGYVDSSAEAIAMLDVVVNFSHFAESFGRTVLEAMAAGKPVVVYDHGALPELVEHGESGYVVPFRKADSAKEYMRELAADADLRRRLGRRGYEIALDRYDNACYVDAMRAAFSEILARENIPIPPVADEKHTASRLGEHDVTAAEVIRAGFDRESPTEPLRIAYFQWHFPVPSETFVLNELRGLVAEGYDVSVYCRQSPHADFRPDFPITWQRVETPEDLAAALAKTDRTIVHSHFTYPTVTDMVWPACRLAGTRFTFCAHAQDIFRHDNDANNRIGEVVSSPECLAVFVPGRFHFHYLVERGVPPEKIVINPQGIDTSLYPEVGTRHATRDTKRLCALHRFTEKKGLEYVIEAAPRLAALGIEIDLYGYGELAGHYRELIDRAGATNVHVHESVVDRDQMIAMFERSDLFLAPSVRAENGDMDGIPTVVIEAMLCGLPVLTTDVSSLPELVMDGRTGVVCKPGDANDFAAAVERFYAMPEAAVERMIESAAAHVRDRFDVARLMRMVKRVWSQTRLDIVLVTWNNLPELTEVVTRIYRHTHFPFHLIICDNGSEDDVVRFLETMQQDHDNVTLIHKGRNSFVGPGTNTAAWYGDSEFIVYVCGKEGFITQPWWDAAVVNYMSEHPDVGLAGTLCYSPSYLHGRDYPAGISEWPNFRHPHFALDNPDRVFCHVQGGFFAMRRAMLDEIGGFSDTVPHNYTDVEFSYYVESCGWKLGELPHVLALYNKTRPNIESRYDETVYAVHPPTLEQREWLDYVARREGAACNACGGFGDAVGDSSACQTCGATPEDRSLYRALAESTLTYRRLPALAAGLGSPLEAFWKKSFQGPWLEEQDLVGTDQCGIDTASDRLHLAVLRLSACAGPVAPSVWQEIRRVLTEDGELWVQNGEQFREDMIDAGFELIDAKRYSSAVIPFDAAPLLRYSKTAR